MHGGVPFHLAFGVAPARLERLKLRDEMRNAMYIVLAELNGAEFDWNTMDFKAPR